MAGSNCKSYTEFCRTLKRPVQSRVPSLEEWAKERGITIPSNAVLEEVTGVLQQIAPLNGFTTRHSAGRAKGLTERARNQNTQRQVIIEQYEQEVPAVVQLVALDSRSKADDAYSRSQYRRYLRKQGIDPEQHDWNVQKGIPMTKSIVHERYAITKTDHAPLGSIKTPGFTSMHIYPGQRYILYPPNPGEGKLCAEPCAHFGCVRARLDANTNCPECGQLIGYGGPVPVNVPSIKCTNDTWVYGYSSILLIHANCYDRLRANGPAAPAGTPVPDPDPLTTEFLQELTDNPNGAFAQGYLNFRLTPAGVDNSDIRLAIWIMQHTYPNTVPAGAEPPDDKDHEDFNQPGIDLEDNKPVLASQWWRQDWVTRPLLEKAYTEYAARGLSEVRARERIEVLSNGKFSKWFEKWAYPGGDEEFLDDVKRDAVQFWPDTPEGFEWWNVVEPNTLNHLKRDGFSSFLCQAPTNGKERGIHFAYPYCPDCMRILKENLAKPAKRTRKSKGSTS